jgi:hypothetical protein
MSVENDPFRNLPNLKGAILDHSRSNFREINFTALDQKMRAAGFCCSTMPNRYARRAHAWGYAMELPMAYLALIAVNAAKPEM